ncbi:hypothetical protein AcW1_001764 [Taiwanofungus camphoratus]|nr:hypothetical protein AcV7_001617 [Antrodia cinnamomea]KAI0945573.1 hypothetical protein AcW1_001764 [Antrodia cinnamomea]
MRRLFVMLMSRLMVPRSRAAAIADRGVRTWTVFDSAVLASLGPPVEFSTCPHAGISMWARASAPAPTVQIQAQPHGTPLCSSFLFPLSDVPISLSQNHNVVSLFER